MATVITFPYIFDLGEPGLLPGKATTMSYGPDDRFDPIKTSGTIIATAYGWGKHFFPGDYSIWVTDLSTVHNKATASGGFEFSD